MRGLRSFAFRFAPAALLLAVALNSAPAKADVTLVDRDGWTFYTSGLVAAHYQLVQGDADPAGGGKILVGGRVLDQSTSSDNSVMPPTLTMSNVRSGFIGTQIGFGMNRQLSQNVRITSFLSISMNGINSNRGQAYQKDVDYREGWAAVESPYGTFKFGRMFGLFASSSAEVVIMAYRYGVGHPCTVLSATISCGSVGAGPLYAGFDGAFRYTSPRLAGFQLQVAMTDPDVGVGIQMSPFPRIDGEINFDQTFGPARLRLYGQSLFDRIENSTAQNGMTAGFVQPYNIWGLMGTGILNIGPFAAGAGGWAGKGIGERIPLEAGDPSNPISFDKANELRDFRGFYGNAQVDLAGTVITAGGGILYVKATPLDADAANSTVDVLKQQYEGHVTVSHKIDALVLEAEYMYWHTDWHFGEKQTLNFLGAGVNYVF